MNVFTAAAVGLSTLTGSLPDKDPFIQHIQTKVTEIIEHSENVPGLKSEEFKSIKLGIVNYWNELVEKGILKVTTTDRDARPYFVALQAVVEHVLAYELNNNNITFLTGAIHTPMPATPLCTEGEISKELVDPSIENNPLQLFTVKARTTIVRDYLYKGGNLYIVYPKEGRTKRTENQQQVYTKELENHPVHLFDYPLDCLSIDNDLIGAFYLFKNREGKIFAFAIQMTQANNPQDLGNFGLWFSEFNQSPVSERVSNVLKMIQQHSSQPMILPI